jgi:16S rRNA (cytosine967-C5)-methyltransferase
MKYFSHLNTAIQILQQYNGKEPFAHYIKKFFSQNKKYGSTDRKNISHLCYCYFRLGHSLKELSIEEKILIAIFLCNHSSNDLLAHLKPEWNKNIHLPLTEKLSIIHYPLLITDIFPWKEELSKGIDYEKFCESFLVQPDLFLRVRPGNEELVREKLLNANIEFQQLNDSCIALNNSTKLEGIIDINKEAVVQDYSSQRVGDFFSLPTPGSGLPTIWDCCAGSGGKSIMAKDKMGDINLTVSDIRKPILVNLQKRFEDAVIKKYKSFAADLSAVNGNRSTDNFDLIIVDVPCSGSGTWGRSCEALYFFEEKEIDRYNELQKKIISNVVPSLQRNGKLVYITCSVFKKENEEMLDFIQQKFQLRLEKAELLKGYDNKADTMFAAAFTAI